MSEVLGVDVENPVPYLLANIVVWVITVGTVQSIFFDMELVGGLIAGLFGGLAFGLTSLYLQSDYQIVNW